MKLYVYYISYVKAISALGYYSFYYQQKAEAITTSEKQEK